LLLSSIGYVAGSADRHLVDLYRRQLARAASNLVYTSDVADPQAVYATWFHTGTNPARVDDDLPLVDARKQVRRDTSSEKLLIDVARAHAQRRYPGEAIAALLDAERLTPEHVRSHHLAKTTISDLLDHFGRRPPAELIDLARRSGATP
jgi:hypothetical protein